MTKPQNNSYFDYKKLAIVVIFVGGLLAFFAFGGNQYLNFETLKQNRELLSTYAQSHYSLALAVVFAIYIVATTLGLPGGAILTLSTGFLFGRWVGTVLVVFAATIGATLFFLAARYLFADLARRRMPDYGKKLMDRFERGAFNYLLFLRMVPLFPFWLINLVPALTSITWRTYVIATAIGIIPGTFIFANLGESLGKVNSADQLFSIEIVIALVLLGGFALIPLWVRRSRAKKTAQAAGSG